MKTLIIASLIIEVEYLILLLLKLKVVNSSLAIILCA